MAYGTITKHWTVPTNGGFGEVFSFQVDGVVDDLSAYSADFAVQQQGQGNSPIVFKSTDASPCVTISGGAVTIDIPSATTLGWTVGAYDVQVRVYGGGANNDRWNLLGPGCMTVLKAPG